MRIAPYLMGNDMPMDSKGISLHPPSVLDQMNGGASEGWRWEARLRDGLRIYLVAFLSLLPGFVIGSLVLLPWYLVIVHSMWQRRADRLLLMFVVWNFLGRGAYHYGLLGPLESAFLIRAMSLTILCALLFVALKVPRRSVPRAVRLFLALSVVLVLLAFFSGIVNGVGIVTLVQYYLINFRWLLFGLIVLTIRLDQGFFDLFLALIVATIGFNSVLGLFQQYILPVQVTPAGYEPDYFDLPSGLLGVTFSHHLTVLCMVAATHYAVRYSKAGDVRDLGAALVFFIQPFTSSSKAIMFIMIVLLIGGIVFAHRSDLFRRGTLLLRMAVLGVVAWAGTTIYVSFNEEIHGTLTDQLSVVTDKLGSIEDFKKLMGYVNVATYVAPNGALGDWFGVGPAQFLTASSGGGISQFADAIEVGTEELDLSSFEKQDTEMVATIGELGWAGCLVYSIAMMSVVFALVKRAAQASHANVLAFRVMTAALGIATMFLTWYTQAWSIAFYYIPLFGMLAYDLNTDRMLRPEKLLAKELRSSTTT